MRITLSGLYLFFTGAIFLTLTGAGVYFLLADYDTIIASVVNTLHKNGLEQKLRNQVFTRQHFHLLQRGAYAIFVIAVFFLWLAIRYRLYVIHLCRLSITSIAAGFRSVKNVFKNNSYRQNMVVATVMLIIASFSLYHILNTYMTYDEMWSYNYYTSNHFYYSFFTYSGYPFFEMISHVFKWLPFPMKFNLRLSSFIFGMATCVLLYACLRKQFKDHFIATAGVIAFAFMPATTIYMVLARGVVHELFFAVAGIFTFLFWLQQPGQQRFLVIYFFAGLLGIYAMPTHAILLLFMLVYGSWHLLKHDKKKVGVFIKVNLFILGLSLLIYLPMLVITGFSVMKGILGRRVASIDVIAWLPRFVKATLLYYSGYHYTLLALLLLGMAIVLWKKNRIPGNLRPIVSIATGLPVSVFLFFLASKIWYPGRSLSFGALMIPLIICLLLQLAIPFLNRFSNVKNVGGAVLLGLIMWWNVFFYFQENPVYKNVAVLSDLFMRRQIATCYDNSSKASSFFYYYPGIEYYYRLKRRMIEFTLSAKNSMRYKPLSPSDRYDCIVYDGNVPDSSRAAGYHALYTDPAGKFKVYINDEIK